MHSNDRKCLDLGANKKDKVEPYSIVRQTMPFQLEGLVIEFVPRARTDKPCFKRPIKLDGCAQDHCC